VSAEEITRAVATRMGRRNFLGRIAKAALMVAAGVAVIPEKIADAAGCCTQCSDYETYRTVACCHLGYYTNCSDLSCFDSNHTWWVWGCCDVLNHNWSCYECCDWRCSKAVAVGNCPQRPAQAQAA